MAPSSRGGIQAKQAWCHAPCQPALPADLTGVKAIAAGFLHSVVLR